MRVRVTIDLSRPLKRRMKIRQSGDAWYWITFKYENVPTFCFICGVLGPSDKLCSQLFVTPEHEILKPYGAWMRAPFKRQIKPIGAKWLRNGNEGVSRSSNASSSCTEQVGEDDNLDPQPKSMDKDKGVTFIETKKRRTDDGLGFDDKMGRNNVVVMELGG